MIRRPIRRRATGTPEGLPATLDPVLRRIYAARGATSAADLELGLENLMRIKKLGVVEEIDSSSVFL